MSVPPSPDTDPIFVGDETAFHIESKGATLLFGIGPRYGSLSREERAAHLLGALAPALSAIRWCSQVHGAELLRIDAGHRSGAACVGSGDGLLTAEQGVGLAVWTADCVPVLLASKSGVAAVHAGWRGTAAGIVPKAVHAMLEAGAEPSGIDAYLGPAVSGGRYPVGNEVIDALKTHGIDEELWLDGHNVDLRGFLSGQLRMLGVSAATLVGDCTASNADLASHRRDGEAAGRQWSLIYRARGSSSPR